MLKISDDGIGGVRTEGAGMRGMQERALLIGARLSVASGPGDRDQADDSRSDHMTRILLADDHALVRRGVRLILDAEPDLEVVAEAADGAEAVEACRDDDVDLAILDIAMPRMTGLQAAREISKRRPEIRILILSMYDNEQYFFESLKAGPRDTC